MIQKTKTWFAGLSKGGKILAATVLAGSVMGVATAGSDTKNQTQNIKPENVSTTTDSPKSAAPKKPVVTTAEQTETKAIAYEKQTVDDSTMYEGESAIRQYGKDGVETLTYKVTMTDGKQTARTLVSSAVTAQKTNEITAVGTKKKVTQPTREASSCDVNYSGACVPVASDVDCQGGSGNGPAYVSGPVYVIGSDIYDLDRDGDGIACD